VDAEARHPLQPILFSKTYASSILLHAKNKWLPEGHDKNRPPRDAQVFHRNGAEKKEIK
jgi:hypothetical protein